MTKTREEIVSMSIVAEIEKACKVKGIKRAKLAEMIFVSRAYVTQIFSGKKTLNLWLICQIEDALNINLISIVNQTA
jgi:ribosome-binding protein aMBF1 (putative translation factor)